MKMAKLTIIMIAVVAIGIFALPTTLSVGAGQHKFLQAGSSTAGQTNLVDFCAQCHGAATSDTIYTNEISQSNTNLYFGTPGTTKIHSSLFDGRTSSAGCASCHEISTGYNTPGRNAGLNKVEHAARLPSCLDCHGIPGDGVISVQAELQNPTEAHKDAFNATQTTDDDIMCIGCHTSVTKSGAISYSFSAGSNVGTTGLHIGT